MREAVKQEIAKEISRQSNEYGSLMMKQMKTNRSIAMFYHDCCTNLNQMATNVFGLKAKDFTVDTPHQPTER